MAEIIKKLTPLSEGEIHTSTGEEYVITEDHSLSDILRFIVDQAQGDKSEIQYLLDHLEAE